MADLLHTLGERIKIIGGSWTAYAAVGSFALYLLGYLALRFHLAALGIGTDLAVLDERYLFTGARFLVYLISSVTSAVLLGLLLVAVLWVPYRLLPPAARNRIAALPSRLASSSPGGLLLAGVVFSVVMIQFVMKNCFEMNNLLLRDTLPDSYLSDWLVRDDPSRIDVYFMGLVVGCAASAAPLLAVRGLVLPAGVIALRSLLTALLAAQLLLLPINHGYLVLDNTLPRVSSPGEEKLLAAGSTAWLVWEGKDAMTFLVRSPQGGETRKSLLTLPRGEIKRVDVLANDPIFPTLFGSVSEKPQ